MSYLELIDALQTQDTDEARELFKLIDVEDSGNVNYKEFLTGLALVNEPGLHNRNKVIEMMFNVFKEPQSQGVTAPGLYKMLQRIFPDLTAETASGLFQKVRSCSRSVHRVVTGLLAAG